MSARVCPECGTAEGWSSIYTSVVCDRCKQPPAPFEITVTRLASGRFLLHMHRSVGHGWTEQWSKRCKTLRQAQAETEIRLGVDVRRVQICHGQWELKDAS